MILWNAGVWKNEFEGRWESQELTPNRLAQRWRDVIYTPPLDQGLISMRAGSPADVISLLGPIDIPQWPVDWLNNKREDHSSMMAA